MVSQPDEVEPSVADLEAQRATEQEALRNVRKLADKLEEEQRRRRQLQKWGLLVGCVVLVVLLGIGVIYLRDHRPPPVTKIDLPAKIVMPNK